MTKLARQRVSHVDAVRAAAWRAATTGGEGAYLAVRDGAGVTVQSTLDIVRCDAFGDGRPIWSAEAVLLSDEGHPIATASTKGNWWNVMLAVLGSLLAGCGDRSADRTLRTRHSLVAQRALHAAEVALLPESFLHGPWSPIPPGVIQVLSNKGPDLPLESLPCRRRTQASGDSMLDCGVCAPCKQRIALAVPDLTSHGRFPSTGGA